MTQILLPFAFEPISLEYIANAKATGQVLGVNPDLKEIWKILLIAGGWGNATKQPVLADLLYERVPTESLPGRIDGHNRKDGDVLRKFKGAQRLEKVLSGHQPISMKEAEAFHLAFREGFGEKWAAEVRREELVQLSAKDLFRKFSELQLLWPSSVTPTKGLQLLAEMICYGPLSIAPAFETNSRAGIRVGGPNELLKAVKTTPLHHQGDRYRLIVDGLEGQDEICVVFELCLDGVQYPNEDDTVEILPVAMIKAKEATEVIFAWDGEPFRIADLSGRFVFVAISLPYSSQLARSLSFMKNEHALTSTQGFQLGRIIRAAASTFPTKVKSALYEYHVTQQH